MENTLRSERQAAVSAKRLYRTAGWGALLSGFTLITAFLIPNEDLSRFFIFILSPLALLPALPALHRVFRHDAYGASQIALLVGMAGMTPVLINLLLLGFQWVTGASWLPRDQAASVSNSLAGFTVLIGVWMGLAGHLGIISELQPPGLCTAAIVAGLTRSAVIGNIVLSSFTTFPQVALTGLWNLGLVLWIASSLVFTGWLGVWFLRLKAYDF